MLLVKVWLLREEDIRRALTPEAAIMAVEESFRALAEGRAILPGVIHLPVEAHAGEAHVKGAYVAGSPTFTIKVASGFYHNPRRGLPVQGGMVMLFSSETGRPEAILFDNGFITELRTGAAGAVAAKYLAPQKVERVAVIGAGSQARYQLDCLARQVGMGTIRSVHVFSRTRNRTEQYAAEMSKRLSLPVTVCDSAAEACAGSQIIITATTSRTPVVTETMISGGVHITAVGADDPQKQELAAEILARADKVVVDSLAQCSRFGELHHAIEQKKLRPEEVYAELGEIVAGKKKGRESDSEITVCDLTGLGVQDAMAAQATFDSAQKLGLGTAIEI